VWGRGELSQASIICLLHCKEIRYKCKPDLVRLSRLGFYLYHLESEFSIINIGTVLIPLHPFLSRVWCPLHCHNRTALSRRLCSVSVQANVKSHCQYSDWLPAGRPGFDPRQGQRIFPLVSASRPALGPTQPPVKWVSRVLSPAVKRGRGVMLTTHPLLVPRLIKSRSYTSCHPKHHHGV
jgi:hypothetical protein